MTEDTFHFFYGWENSMAEEIKSTACGQPQDQPDLVEKSVTQEDDRKPEGPKLSKNQLKKQRKKERWLAVKHEKRKEEKEKRKKRLAARREAGQDLGPPRKSLKSNTMLNSACKIRVAIDLSLDSYMVDKDVTSLIRQLQESYSTNRRAENPLQLYLTGLCGKTKERLDKFGDYKNWDVHRETKGYEAVFPKSSLVYLSSDSPNLLDTLREDQVYVIGGLVDHNVHKGLCHRLAEEKGIHHAQLPISEFIQMSTRKVLAVNHVFSILLRFTERHNWKDAFLAEMPQRKQFQLKESADPQLTPDVDGSKVTPNGDTSAAEITEEGKGSKVTPNGEPCCPGEDCEEPKPLPSAPEEGGSGGS